MGLKKRALVMARNQVDVLKELCGVETDAQLADSIGISRQALSGARDRNRLSAAIVEKAALKYDLDMAVIKDALQKAKSASCEDLSAVMFCELQKMAAENRALHQDKEDLLREIGHLEARIARLEERLKSH